MKTSDIKNQIRIVQDYPKKGISFLDITTILENPKTFKSIIKKMKAKLNGKKIDKIVALDARGFIFASPLAIKLDAGIVMARKKGKLPHNTISCSYGLEYGKDKLEIHKDSIKEGENVLIVDDVLATGGTAEAAMKLSEKLNGNIIGFIFLAEIAELNGREKLNGSQIHTLIKY